VLLMNLRQLTSEIGRLWLIVGAAWFFYLRGTPLAERFARSGSSLGSLARYVRPLLFVVAVLVGAMVVTRDMGPLLIAGYGAARSSPRRSRCGVPAAWRRRRRLRDRRRAVRRMDRRHHAVLFRVGALDDVAAARLEKPRGTACVGERPARARHVVPARGAGAGFGPGAVPWCGFGARGACAACRRRSRATTRSPRSSAHSARRRWALTIGCALWLHLLIRATARRRAASRASSGAAGAWLRRAGVPELAVRDVGRAHAVPAGGHGRGNLA
jgi:hypothetical protein